MNVEITSVDGALVLVCEGAVSLDDFRGAIEAMGRHPEFTPGSPTVWDLRKATGVLHPDEMRSLTGASTAVRMGQTARVGLVAAADHRYGGARMYVGLAAERLPHHVRVFRGFDEALAWVIDRREADSAS